MHVKIVVPEQLMACYKWKPSKEQQHVITRSGTAETTMRPQKQKKSLDRKIPYAIWPFSGRTTALQIAINTRQLDLTVRYILL